MTRALLQLFLDQHGVRHFAAPELRCHATGEYPPDAWFPRILPVIRAAEHLRILVGRPVVIPPGGAYRSPSAPLMPGQAPLSRHRSFRALDLRVPSGLDAVTWCEMVDREADAIEAIGIRTGRIFYPPTPRRSPGFVHLDAGDRTTRHRSAVM